MGGLTFTTRQKGKDLDSAYKRAVDEAREEHGHEQGYSGAINSTYGVVDITPSYKNSKLSLPQFIDEKLRNCSKGQCYAICTQEPVKNNNKIKTQVEHIVNKGTMKWLLKYAVYEYGDPMRSFPTKGQAVSFARAHTEKTGRSTNVVMEKVLEKGSPTVAMITYKKSSTEKLGEWVFFGITPY